jgi:hypothetical protein
MAWFRAEFGDEPLRRPVVTPTREFFPGPFTGGDEEVRGVVDRVCGYAAVDPARVTVEFYGDHGERELAIATGLDYRSAGAAGHFRRENGRAVIAIDRTLASTPVRLIATIAHELGHVRLLDEDRIRPDRADHEPLTDLLTVYLGLGIFTANAAFEYTQTHQHRSTNRLGYLTEPMFGYGLACYAMQRDEPDPDWARHLDVNPRTLLTRGIRFLTAGG